MPARARTLAVLLTVGWAALTQLSACSPAASSSSAASTTPRPTAGSTASATPVPTPEQLGVTVVATGLGAYEETTIPIAVVQTTATTHAAQGVTLHLVVETPDGRPIRGVDATISVIDPGQVQAVAARIALTASGSDRVAATVTSVAAWPQSGPGPDPRLPGALRCRTASCSGFADVAASLPDALRAASDVTATAVCTNAAGGIVGGDSSDFAPPPADGTVVVPVILSSHPAACTVYANAGF